MILCGWGLLPDSCDLRRTSMQIPHSELAPKTLDAIVLEFVTRDGTDHSPVKQRVESVLRQLDQGEVELHFDPETESCNIIRV